jgi:iron complex outermembrane recepter protein
MRIAALALTISMSIVGLSVASDVQASIKRRTNIPPEPLGVALQALAKECDFQVVYLVDLLKGVQTHGASGDLTTEEALTKLLDDTGLTYRYLNPKTITIVNSGGASSLSSQEERAKGEGSTNDQGKSDASKESSGDSLHLARADQATPAEASSVDKKKDRNPQKDFDERIELEEVIVTATRRGVAVQKLPESVTAITSERLEELNAQTFEDYFRTVPGLSVVRAPDGSFDFNIRGIQGGTSVQNVSATVGQYIDEIPVTAAGAQLDPRLVDVERIEVLRGPQGTYFGEGSLGGTIRQITKKPDLEDFSAHVDGRLSDTYNGGINNQESAMINLPLITDMLGFRGSFVDAADSGYINLLNDTSTAVVQKDINPGRSDGGRVMLLFKPSDRISILGEGFHTTSVSQNSSLTTVSDGDLVDAQTPAQPACSGPPLCISPQPATPPSYLYQKRRQIDDLYNGTVTVNFDSVSLVSSSSWSDVKTNDYVDTVYDPLLPYQLSEIKGFIEEARVVSTAAWSKRVDYVAGVYYADTTHDTLSWVAPTVVNGPAANRLTVPDDLRTIDKAIFAEGGYAFTDQLDVRLGVRKAKVSNEGPLSSTVTSGGPPGGGSPGGPPGPLPGPPIVTVQTQYFSQSATPTTGRAVVNYNINQDAMVYASVSTGFRTGGVNGSAAEQPAIPKTYQPDYTTNYEFGWKLSFPSQRATLNGALYHIDWRDIQVQSYYFAPASPLENGYTSNAGKAKVDGFELESGLELLKGLRANASLSVIDARAAEDMPLGPHGNCQVTCSGGLKGQEIPDVSRVSGSASLNYTRRLASSGLQGFINVNEAYTGPRNNSFYGNGTGEAFARMSGYWSSNWQLGVSDARWRASLYVDNVFNNRPEIYKNVELGQVSILTTQPRTVGIVVGRTFD